MLPFRYIVLKGYVDCCISTIFELVGAIVVSLDAIVYNCLLGNNYRIKYSILSEPICTGSGSHFF